MRELWKSIRKSKLLTFATFCFGSAAFLTVLAATNQLTGKPADASVRADGYCNGTVRDDGYCEENITQVAENELSIGGGNCCAPPTGGPGKGEAVGEAVSLGGGGISGGGGVSGGGGGQVSTPPSAVCCPASINVSQNVTQIVQITPICCQPAPTPPTPVAPPPKITPQPGIENPPGDQGRNRPPNTDP